MLLEETRWRVSPVASETFNNGAELFLLQEEPGF